MAKVLRVYLALVFLANFGGMANLAVNLDGIMADFPRLNSALAATLFLAGIGSMVAMVLIWRWHRAGLYLVTAAYALMLTVNLYYQAPLAHTLLGPIGLAILFVLIWPLRKRFSTMAK